MPRFTPKAPRQTGIVPAGLIAGMDRKGTRGRPPRVWRNTRSAPNVEASPEKLTEAAASDTAATSPLTTLSSTSEESETQSHIEEANDAELDGSSDSLSGESNKAPGPTHSTGGKTAATNFPETLQFDEWASEQHSSPERRIAGRFAADKSHDNWGSEASLPIPWHPEHMETAGVNVVRTWLRPNRAAMSAEEGYEKHIIPLAEVHKFFDGLEHDYNLRRHTVYRGVSIRWLDGPGLSPADIRARRFTMSVSEKALRARPEGLVWRVLFLCNGACASATSHESVFKGPILSGTDTLPEELVSHAIRRSARKSAVGKSMVDPHMYMDDDPEEPDLEEIDDEAVVGEVKKRCSARCVVEMTAQQCRAGFCSITLKSSDYHPPALVKSELRESPYVRRLLHQAATNFGVTMTRLQEWWHKDVADVDQHAVWLKRKADWRLPDTGDFKQAVTTANNMRNVHRDPIVAIAILGERHPERFIALDYPHILGKGASQTVDRHTRFQCIIAPPTALLTGILQIGLMGMYMDSSWRNKNAFNCPLTLLVTLNQFHRMVPLAAMVSNHADARAYEFLLSSFKTACEKAAHDYLDGRLKVAVPGASARDLRRACRTVCEDGLQPRFMMIDGSDPELTAIRRVYPHMAIRVCQFHMMQACRSKIRRIFATQANADIKTQGVLEAIRQCQRCDDVDEWPQYFANLESEVNTIAGDEGESWNSIRDYLMREWFADRWIRLTVDYGLPRHVSRDGPWSTNNYSEAAFRTFDRVFLGCRANKRLDRLISVIINNYFPFYENTPPDQPRADPSLQRNLSGGLRLWDQDAIRPCPKPSVPAIHRALFQAEVFCIITPADEDPRQPMFYCGLKAGGQRDICTCRYWSATGKLCKHIWAMKQLELCSPVQQFEENVAVVIEFLRKRRIALEARENIPEDEDVYQQDRAEFEAYWGEDLNTLSNLSEVLLDPPASPALPAIASTTTPEPLARQRSSPPPARIVREITPVGRRHQDRPIREDPSHGRTPSTRVESDDHNILAIEGSVSGPSSDVFGTVTPLEISRAPKHTGRSEEAVTGLRSLPGRPAKIKPKDPTRRSAAVTRQSTLALPAKAAKQLEGDRPVGVRNTGADCYALALLQVLMRNQHFIQAYETSWPHIGKLDMARNRHEVVVEQLYYFRQAISQDNAKQLPGLRQTLYDQKLVPSMGQEDPKFLFQRLIEHLDIWTNDLDERIRFRDLFSLRTLASARCTHCGTSSISATDSMLYPAIYIRPDSANDRSPEKHMSDMIYSGLDDNITSHQHLCNPPDGCGLEFTAKSETMLSTCGPLLCLNVNWTEVTDTTLLDPAAELVVDTQFRFPMRFTLDPRLSLRRTVHDWTLVGVVCRTGTSLSSGHNFAIIRHSNHWWTINDDTVTLCHSPSTQAWSESSFPTMLFYQRSDGTGGRFEQVSTLSTLPTPTSTLPSAVAPSTGSGTTPATPLASALDAPAKHIQPQQAMQGSSTERDSSARDNESDPSVDRPRSRLETAPAETQSGSEVTVAASPPKSTSAKVSGRLKSKSSPLTVRKSRKPSLKNPPTATMPRKITVAGESIAASVRPLSDLLPGKDGGSTTPQTSSPDLEPGALHVCYNCGAKLAGTYRRRIQIEGETVDLCNPCGLEYRVRGSLSKPGQPVEGGSLYTNPLISPHRPASSSPPGNRATAIESVEHEDTSASRLEYPAVQPDDKSTTSFADDVIDPLLRPRTGRPASVPLTLPSPTATLGGLPADSSVPPSQAEIVTSSSTKTPSTQSSTTDRPAVTLAASTVSETPLERRGGPSAPGATDKSDSTQRIGPAGHPSELKPALLRSPVRPASTRRNKAKPSLARQAVERQTILRHGSTSPTKEPATPRLGFEASKQSTTAAISTAGPRTLRPLRPRPSTEVQPESTWKVYLAERSERIKRSLEEDSTSGEFEVRHVSQTEQKESGQSKRKRKTLRSWKDAYEGISDLEYVERVLERFHAADILKRTGDSITAMKPDQQPLESSFFELLKSRLLEHPNSHGLENGMIMTGDSSMRPEVLDLMGDASSWWSTELIDPICAAAVTRANKQVSSSETVRYQPFLLSWSADGPVPYLDGIGNSLPWPTLGKDRSWRDRITVAVINTSPGAHFVALAILGPIKMILPIDAAGGLHDHVSMKIRWRTLLHARMDYELRKGWVTDKDNAEWLSAPNIPELRNGLEWAVQMDGHSCGPLAAAACVQICEGFRPTAVKLGWASRWPMEQETKRTRDILVALLLWENLCVSLKQSNKDRHINRIWLQSPLILASMSNILPKPVHLSSEDLSRLESEEEDNR